MNNGIKRFLVICIIFSMAVGFCGFRTNSFADEDVFSFRYTGARANVLGEIPAETLITESSDKSLSMRAEVNTTSEQFAEDTQSGLAAIDTPNKAFVTGTLSEPVVTDIESGPIIEDTPTEPITEEIQSEPTKADTLNDLVIEDMPTAPVAEETSKEPVVADIESGPIIEDTPTEPVTEEIQSEPTMADTLNDLVIEDMPTAPVAEETSKEPVVADIESDPVIEDTPTEPITEEIQSEPTVVDTFSEPVIDDTLTDSLENSTPEEKNTEEEQQPLKEDTNSEGTIQTVNSVSEEEVDFVKLYGVYIDAYKTYGELADLSAISPELQEKVKAFVDNRPEIEATEDEKSETGENQDAESEEEDSEGEKIEEDTENKGEETSQKETQEEKDDEEAREGSKEGKNEDEQSESITADLKSPPPAGSEDGWHQDDETSEWYYFEGGEPVTGLKEIEGVLYAFNNAGIRYNDTVFTIYDEFGESHGYRAKADGSLYRNEWYNLGPDQQIYYTENGDAAKSGIINIEGKLYGFEYEPLDDVGYLYKNTDFYMNGHYYRAEPDGALYTDTWYDDEYGSRYYYGGDGAAYSGLWQIGEKQYYFDSNGYMNRNGTLIRDDENAVYVINEDGVVIIAVESKPNSWTKVGERYIYRDGETTVCEKVIRINGTLYAFDWQGFMYADCETSEYDSETGSYYFVRAKANGALYENEWYQDVNGGWQHFNAGGKASSGLEIVNGKQYYFNENGWMYSDTTVVDDGLNQAFVIDAEGIAVAIDLKENGWTSVGTSYVFRENGVSVRSQIKEINGKRYGFNDSGIMYNNDESFEIYNSSVYEYVNYRAKAGGELYSNAWYNDSGSWYYYSEDGSAVTREVRLINGKLYGFDYHGVMYNDTIFFYEGQYYRAKPEGTLCVNEWYKDNETWYYYGESGIAPYGYTKINQKWYYFGYQGWMRVNETVLNDEGNKVYVIDTNGIASEYSINGAGWTQVGTQWFYSENGSALRNQIQTINGKIYYFIYNGTMLDNYYQAGRWNESAGRVLYYRAKPGGELYQNEWYIDYTGNRYYYGAGGASVPRGRNTIEGKEYYFSDDAGRLCSGEVLTIDDDYYIVGVDGQSLTGIKNGWQKIDGLWFFVENGTPVMNDLRKIDGKNYLFESSGRMLAGKEYRFNNNISFRARTDGTLYENQWVKGMDGHWYYYGEHGISAGYGRQEVKGVFYYFNYNGRMCSDEVLELDGSSYVVSADGKSLHQMTGSNWMKLDGFWFYSVDGTGIKSSVRTIGNKNYYFDYRGRMLDNNMWSTTINGERISYRAKPGGELYKNEWFINGNNKYYYGSDSGARGGEQIIDGRSFYFSENGILAQGMIVRLNGKYYVGNSDGTSVTALKKDGWTESNRYWFYTENGIPVISGYREINGKAYFFDSNGRMLDNNMWNMTINGERISYRAKPGGELWQNAWVKSANNDWYYYGEKGIAAGYGLQEINGKKYYFTYNGRMCADEVIELDGATYVVSGDGQTLNKMSGTGWKKVDNFWFYSVNGVATQTGMRTIRNKNYYFDYRGRMLDNSMWNTTINGERISYRAKPGGVLYQNEWVENGNYKYYFGTDSMARGGKRTIDGKTYYFGDYGILAENYVVKLDGNYYVGNSDGTSLIDMNKEGWTEVNGYWFYCENGIPVISDIRTINNKLYLFTNQGQMLVTSDNNYYTVMNGDSVQPICYRAKESGELLQDEWFIDENGRTWYYDSRGRSVFGESVIHGKTYYFSDYGQLAVNAAVKAGNKYYVTNGTGTELINLNKNGWTKVDDYWFYSENGTPAISTKRTINGKMYYFNGEGHMLSNATANINLGNSSWGMVGAKQSGELYQNEWVKFNNGWYYFGADGLSLVGKHTVNGKTYYFENGGRMASYSSVKENGVYYVVGSDGSKLYSLKKNGWTRVDDYWFYCENGVPVKNMLKEINGSKYVFRSNGQMLANDEQYGLYDGTSGNYVYYRAKAGGQIYRNEWYNQGNGRWRYYGSDGKAYSKLQIVDGKKYYFNIAGLACKNMPVYVKGEGYFIVGNDGYSLTKLTNNAWTKVDGYWYYTKNNYPLGRGTYTIDGKQVTFDENGRWIS